MDCNASPVPFTVPVSSFNDSESSYNLRGSNSSMGYPSCSHNVFMIRKY